MNGLRKQFYVATPNTVITSKDHNLMFTTKDSITSISLDDVDCLYIENKSVTISMNAINACLEEDVMIVTLDDRHNPYSQILKFYGGSSLGKAIHSQLKWPSKSKSELTKYILINKYRMQKSCLRLSSKSESSLENNKLFDNPVLLEGNIARCYFAELFGCTFRRGDGSEINSKLNYGYSIIVSYINRTIVSHGFLTNLGIHHSSKDNLFNLSYDFFEPFRPFVDFFVYKTLNDEFNRDYKIKTAELLDKEIKLGSKRMEVRDCIDAFVTNCLNCLSGSKTYYDEVGFDE